MARSKGKYDFDLDLNDPLRNTFLSTVAAESVVLEFGPAIGFTTQYLQESLKCKVYIVELEEGAYAQARQYAEGGLCGDLELLAWEQEFSGIQFDYILFADVLEHLKDPLSALKRARTLLKDSGHLVVSIPNIAYGGVSLSLMNNAFRYTMHGILDDTHLKHFTDETFTELLEKAGYAVERKEGFRKEIIESEFVQYAQCLPKTIEQYVLDKEWSQVYQYLFVATKDSKPMVRHPFPVRKTTDMPAYLYYDLGQGFSEENKIYERVSLGKGRLLFHLPPIGAVKQVRIDIPSNASLICGASYVTIAKKEKLYPSLDNATYVMDGFSYYTESVAQFIIDLSNYSLQATELEWYYDIQVDYEAGSCSRTLFCVKRQIQQMQRQMKEMETKNNKQKATLMLQKTELASQDEKLATQDEKLNCKNKHIEKQEGEIWRLGERILWYDEIVLSMQNSMSWKITWPLRFIATLFKKLFVK